MPRPKLDMEKTDLSELLPSKTIDRSRAIGGQVYELMRLHIILDDLKPGMSLYEHDVCNWLNVSRTPVREAFQKLMADGLMITQPKVGSIVAKIDDNRVKEGLVIRRALETEVVKVLCGMDVDFGALDPFLALQKVALSQSDYISFFKQDELFHQKLAELADLPSAWRLAQSVKAHADRARIRIARDLPNRNEQAYEEHLDLIEVMKAKDPELAQSRIHAHLNRVFDTTG